MKIRHVAILLAFSPVYSAYGATEPSTVKVAPTQPVAKARVSSGKPKSRTTASDARTRIGVGVGMQNLYLPVSSFELIFGFRNFTVSPEFGYLKFTRSDFSGLVTFAGLDGRWILTPGKALFLGLTSGLRTVDVTTYGDVEYIDSRTGASSATNIAWHRHVSQMIVNPRVGWIWAMQAAHDKGRESTANFVDKDTLGQGGAFSLAFGLLIPFASKATISGSPGSATGVTDEQYQALADKKLNDVSSKTNGVLPSVEIKYMYFIR